MTIDPHYEALTFPIDTTADITLGQFASALAECNSQVQAAFFDSFLDNLMLACGDSTFYFETQISQFVKTMTHERTDSLFAKEWLGEE